MYKSAMIGQSAVARSVFMALAVVLGAAAAAGAAAADCVSLQKCANLSEDGSRLACYDGLMRAATADPNEPSKNFWSGPVGHGDGTGGDHCEMSQTDGAVRQRYGQGLCRRGSRCIPWLGTLSR